MKKIVNRKGAVLLMLLISVFSLSAQQGQTYVYRIAKAGAIKPAGWIKNQMERDLAHGLIGQFDQINNTVAYNLFVAQNRFAGRRYDNRMDWWSGEHEGYWKDAIVRMAYLTGNQRYIDSAKRWVDDIVTHVDATGYIGIYASGNEPNTRYNFTGANGELWTQSRMLMALAAYYEFTGEERVLEGVEKAVQLTMDAYREKNPFAYGRDGGTGHGVGFVEVLEWLARTTGKTTYAEFAQKLYDDLDRANTNINDLAPKRLGKRQLYFGDHGAHVAEGFFIPFWMDRLYQSPEYKRYAQNAMFKLNYSTTPSGALRADENVSKRKGTANEAYEYCGITEMISPFNRIISFTGDLRHADRTERAVFNAAQGARFADMSGVSYLTTDNRLTIDPEKYLNRYAYDCNHQAAACCALNSGRLMPYYVEGMWMDKSDESGIAAVLFGPSSYTTNLKGVAVTVDERTSYPFSDEIDFVFTVSEPASFTFTFRKPFGVQHVDIGGISDAKMDSTGSTVSLTRVWKTGDRVRVGFDFEIEEYADVDSTGGEQYVIQRGPLVFALAFPYARRPLRAYNTSGFYKWDVVCTDSTGWDYQLPEKPVYELVANDRLIQGKFPFDDPVVSIQTRLRNIEGKDIKVSLVPMGNTVLRRVSFPKAR
ncbi:beta-L-arabinofuranosidase domain-containing protein [Parapedobacter sp. 2B3]|uniref:beta-L-arabinofuranosidase domain-containing protein n=1 Tax=Parapedobacter sp. 2B3 TaxID=3342381 RepID=UPI0035B5A0B8